MKRPISVLFISVLLLLACVISNKLLAQGPPPPPPPPPTANIPIDGGISILIAAGAAYGAKKVYDKRKNK